METFKVLFIVATLAFIGVLIAYIRSRSSVKKLKKQNLLSCEKLRFLTLITNTCNGDSEEHEVITRAKCFTTADIDIFRDKIVLYYKQKIGNYTVREIGAYIYKLEYQIQALGLKTLFTHLFKEALSKISVENLVDIFVQSVEDEVSLMDYDSSEYAQRKHGKEIILERILKNGNASKDAELFMATVGAKMKTILEKANTDNISKNRKILIEAELVKLKKLFVI